MEKQLEVKVTIKTNCGDYGDQFLVTIGEGSNASASLWDTLDQVAEEIRHSLDLATRE